MEQGGDRRFFVVGQKPLRRQEDLPIAVVPGFLMIGAGLMKSGNKGERLRFYRFLLPAPLPCPFLKY